MPATQIVFFKEEDGSVPVLDWLKKLPNKAVDKCRVKLERLALLGHELRRPEADFLRSGIYELRPSYQGVNYRILYFFHGSTVAVVSHGIVKEAKVPEVEIARALHRKALFETSPGKHTATE